MSLNTASPSHDIGVAPRGGGVPRGDRGLRGARGSAPAPPAAYLSVPAAGANRDAWNGGA